MFPKVVAWSSMMSAELRTQSFSERTIRQVKLDCNRAMLRESFCPDRSDLVKLRCVDDQLETDQSFGCQLWYFEGEGVDEQEQRRQVFGVVEYSLQFGLHELVEDRVFETDIQREQFRQLYDRGGQSAGWHHPANRWLALGLMLVAFVWLAYLFVLSPS